MSLIKQYKKDPCKTLSIPYWKHMSFKQPAHLDIIHSDDFNESDAYIKVESFFRLMHRLDTKPSFSEEVEVIDFDADVTDLVAHINASYTHENITITKKTLREYTKRAVYDEGMWVKIVKDGNIVASCLADVDQGMREGMIEWLQVSPEYHNKGYGKKVLSAVISRLSEKVDFITVSGRLENTKNPLNVYLACGFTGNDVWKICTRK